MKTLEEKLKAIDTTIERLKKRLKEQKKRYDEKRYYKIGKIVEKAIKAEVTDFDGFSEWVKKHASGIQATQHAEEDSPRIAKIPVQKQAETQFKKPIKIINIRKIVEKAPSMKRWKRKAAIRAQTIKKTQNIKSRKGNSQNGYININRNKKNYRKTNFSA